MVYYILDSIKSKKLDFYLETDYYPYNRDKKFEHFSEGPNTSRIPTFHKLYNEIAEKDDKRLRLHSSDIRSITKVETVNDKSKKAQFEIISKCFNACVNLTYFLIGYKIDTIRKDYLVSAESNEIKYDNNKNFFDNYVKDLKVFKDVMTNHQQTIKNILEGDDSIMEFTKIKRQKEELFKSWGEQKEIKSFITEIENYKANLIDTNSKAAFEFYEKIYNILNPILDTIPTTEYMENFLETMLKINNIDALNEPALLILNMYMDLYTIFRMLRKFDGGKQENVVFFGGNLHVEKITEALLGTKMFNLIVEQKSAETNKADCQLITQKS